MQDQICSLSKENENILLSLIIPVLNEEATIPIFLKKINNIFNNIEYITLEIVFINDGSSDDTLTKLLEMQYHDPRIIVVDLSRNFGKEAALSAGLEVANGRVIVPLDVDLQDPPELIPAMVAKWREGYEVVVGRRARRDEDSWAKRISARWFYRVHNAFADQKLPENVGDFRLMDRSVVNAINALPESCRFMKGLFAWVGFRTTYIDYARPARVAGESKFNAWRLWNFALDGITSFSTVPLRIWAYIGFALAFTAFIFATLLFFASVHFRRGCARLYITDGVHYFFGGLQLIGIGVLGEYLGRNYIESKRRPVFLIRKIYK